MRAKIAISIPEDLLAAVDEAAEGSGESRSGYISRVLSVATRARSDAEITRRLNHVFRQPGVGDEQLRVADEMESAGSDWSDELWLAAEKHGFSLRERSEHGPNGPEGRARARPAREPERRPSTKK